MLFFFFLPFPSQPASQPVSQSVTLRVSCLRNSPSVVDGMLLREKRKKGNIWSMLRLCMCIDLSEPFFGVVATESREGKRQ